MLILIDNYDSFTYNLVHYFQEIGENVKVYRNDEVTVNQVFEQRPDYIVISPGPSIPSNSGICMELILENSKKKKIIPTLGVCLGHQVIAECFNSKVVQSGEPIHGKVSKIYYEKSLLFEKMNNPFEATRYHSLIVEHKSLSNDLVVTASTKDRVIMAIEHTKFPIFGVQFHPESIATEDGHKLLKNFLRQKKKL